MWNCGQRKKYVEEKNMKTSCGEVCGKEKYENFMWRSMWKRKI